MHGNQWVGCIVLFIGGCALLGILGLGSFIGPMIFAGVGYYFLRHKHRLIASICFVLAIFVLFEAVLHINIGGLFVAVILIYIGYRMVTGRDMPKWLRRKARHRRREERSERREARREERREVEEEDDEDWLDEEIEKLHREQRKKKTQSEDEGDSTVQFKSPRFRNSMIGDFHLLNSRFELDDMNISYGIGDVKIDLSKAIIPEGESTIVISGLIGDVDIYVPYDLDVSVNATVTFGELEILGYKQGGVNRQISLSTKEYELASRKVKISISSFIGDIDVRFL